jgi:RNase P/RNase MRP subunit POP5
MRENYRYILAGIYPPCQENDAKEIYLAANEAFSSLFGEVEGSRAWIAVMECTDEFVIFRYRRGTDTQVEAALATIMKIGERLVVIHPVKKSGTIRTIREEIQRKNTKSVRCGNVQLGETWHRAVFSQFKNIDLKEKGINLQIPLYITEEDIKDLNYDE